MKETKVSPSSLRLFGASAFASLVGVLSPFREGALLVRDLGLEDGPDVLERWRDLVEQQVLDSTTEEGWCDTLVHLMFPVGDRYASLVLDLGDALEDAVVEKATRGMVRVVGARLGARGIILLKVANALLYNDVPKEDREGRAARDLREYDQVEEIPESMKVLAIVMSGMESPSERSITLFPLDSMGVPQRDERASVEGDLAFGLSENGKMAVVHERDPRV